jgi:WD40 repeat protein
MKFCRCLQVGIGVIGLFALCAAEPETPRIGGGDATRPPHAIRQEDRTVVVTRDGKFFAAFGANGAINYCDAKGQQMRTFYHCSVRAAVFSSDGRLLCTAGGRKDGATTLVVWDVSNGKPLWSIPTEGTDKPAMCFNEDKTLLAFSLGSSRVQLFDLCRGAPAWSAALNRRVAGLEFDRDELALLVHCGDKSTKALSVVDGSPRKAP